MSYAVIKSIHLISVIAWMAALLYVGRIFVYWVESNSTEVKSTLAIMARRLNLFIGLPAGIISTLVGFHLAHQINAFSMPWFHYKMGLIILLFGYQHAAGRISKKLRLSTFNKTSRWCRIFNEVPTILLVGIIFSVVTKNIALSIIAQSIITSAIGLFFILKTK